jgi:predicted Fe-S protein YdhL (DUF1289 family)
MALFPKVQSPCPYKNNLASIMEGENCRMCNRRVFDLTSMSDDERLLFMERCKGEVCVSYKLPIRSAVALALAATAMTAPLPVAAQELLQEELIVGGIRDVANVEYRTADDNATLPDIAVVYDEAARPEAAAPPARPAASPKTDTLLAGSVSSPAGS